jgi:hypothetical protein
VCLAAGWTLLVCVAAVFLHRQLLWSGPSPLGFGASLSFLWERLTDFGRAGENAIKEGVIAWGMVFGTGLLGSLLGLRRLPMTGLATLAGLVPILWFVLIGTGIEGQYLLSATPFVVLGTTLVLPQAFRGLPAVALTVAVAVHTAWSIYYRSYLGHDENRVWAEAVAGVVQPPAVVVCSGTSRTRWVRRITGQEVFNLVHLLALPPAQVAEVIEVKSKEVRSEGLRVYLDRRLLHPEGGLPIDRQIADALRARWGQDRIPAEQPVWELR